MRNFTRPLLLLMIFFSGLSLSATKAINVKLNFDSNNPNQLKLSVEHAQKDCDITVSNRATGFHKTYKLIKDKHNSFTLPKKMTPVQDKGKIDLVINGYYNKGNYDDTFNVNKNRNTVQREAQFKRIPNLQNAQQNREHNRTPGHNRAPGIKPTMDKSKAYNYADQQARTVANRIVKSYGERERYDLYLASGFQQGYTDINYRDLNIALNDLYILKGYNDGLENTDRYITDSVTCYFTKKLPSNFNAPARFGTDEFYIKYTDHNPNTMIKMFISGGKYKVRQENLSASFAYKEWKNNRLGGRYDYNLYNKMSLHEKIKFERNFKDIFKQVIDKKFNDALKIKDQAAFDEGVKLGKVIRGYELGLERATDRRFQINFTTINPLFSFMISAFK